MSGTKCSFLQSRWTISALVICLGLVAIRTAVYYNVLGRSPSDIPVVYDIQDPHDDAQDVRQSLSGKTDSFPFGRPHLVLDDKQNTNKPTSQNKTKVLFLTYMRGGSTLLSEMLNENPKATLWFEPIDGAYSELYGSVPGWFPVDIYYDTDGHKRSLPEFEEDAIFETVNNLMTCNIKGLPTDTLGHHAMVDIPQKRFTDYISCIKDVHRTTRTPAACKQKIRSLCPRYFTNGENDPMSLCYNCIHMPSSGFSQDVEQSQNSSYCRRHSDAFFEYNTCMAHYRRAIGQCIPKLESVCEDSTIVGAKTIRLGLDTARKLLHVHPDLKVVYQMRDPRAIVWSRRMTGLLSHLSEKNLTQEATFLCGRLFQEQITLLSMLEEFPGRIVRIRYEDLVRNPVVVAENVYHFLGASLPDAVSDALRDHIHAEKADTAFGTSRVNGTTNIDKWRKYISAREIRHMTESCSGILELYQYQS